MASPDTAPHGGRVCIDGNEAVAQVAHALSEVIAIYPITPASPMGEYADVWSAAGRSNVWGTVPEVVEMQAEGGAAGALHGAVTEGALATTFTASQGLLLMIPNLFKIAGELTPAVVHVAARTVATHALSIFGDHSDVMAARSTGCAMLCSSSVQEAHDLAAVAHGATLAGRVPFLHFFDGFRTSHEINTIRTLDSSDLRALIDDEDVLAHRERGLSPENPSLRGSAQNPDVFFQAREAVNAYYDSLPAIVADRMERLAGQTGRRYGLVDYEGAPDAERVLVLMGSGAGAAREAVRALSAEGERVGVAVIRLFRPFPVDAFLEALPDTTRAVAVLDRTKEPGAVGEPLFTDVISVLAETADTGDRAPVHVVGGRYGLSSKEFTPAMAKAALDELTSEEPQRRFTVGIVDDVTRLSLPVDPGFRSNQAPTRAVFFALGSDGTVSANKSSIRIIGEQGGQEAQGYFVYDSRKAGATTVSHLRFGPEPIESTYLVDDADFVACHQFHMLNDVDVLAPARPGATFLLNAPYAPDEVWDNLPVEIQERLIDDGIELWIVDAHRIASELGLAGRINTVMQTCFFDLTSALETEEAIRHVKASIESVYAKAGPEVVRRNLDAVDRSLEALCRVEIPRTATSGISRRQRIPDDAPDFVRRVTARLLAGEGDLLPVSALPVDGIFPTDTACYEKRGLAHEIPIWEPDLCIDCGKCAIVCPHAAIRMKVYRPDTLEELPGEIPTKSFRSREADGLSLTIQVAPDDCTGCGICVDVCPAHSKSEVRHKAINMRSAADHRDVERGHFERFLAVPEIDRRLLAHDSVKGSQILEPLFEFSGACAGCGETPYLKLLTQLFGDRLIVANATGCSSIYGGNLPTTPWARNDDGRGPAWSNSLFEDNAEFGLGMGLGLDRHVTEARRLLRNLASTVGTELATDILGADQSTEAGIAAQRARVCELRTRLADLAGDEAAFRLASVADRLVRTSVWIVGGDGWAYDIGFGGLDHTLASGRDVNMLVLDTEVYSNTGGQASKATPRAAVAKFAAAGKTTPKKDLGAIAMAYGNVYVAQVALGGSDIQTVRAFQEADAWPGPALVIAYSTCIAHGIDMSRSMGHQKDAVRSGYWPLYRFHPGPSGHEHPFHLDSHAPTMSFRDFASGEARFAMLARSDPGRADALAELAQADVDERWRFYEQLVGIERTVPHVSADDAAEAPGEDRGSGNPNDNEETNT
ncbi:MAG: pyruvate:ferredoxin (flavodoxin) oxidoreductase [Acidimicrobiia bacterium]